MPAAPPRSRPRGGPKPIDVGTGIVSASLTPDGRWLSLGAVHRGHGFVELAAVPQIEPAWRARPDLVRRYRAMLADERFCFLDWQLEPAEKRLGTRRRWLGGGHQVVGRYRDWSHLCTTRPSVGRREIVQRHVLRATGAGHPSTITLRVQGRVDRPALAEITELEPPTPTGAQTTWSAEGGRLSLVAAELPAAATIDVRAPDRAAWQVVGDGARLSISWPAQESEVRFDVACALDGGNS